MANDDKHYKVQNGKNDLKKLILETSRDIICKNDIHKNKENKTKILKIQNIFFVWVRVIL